jgi:hypothetical protein
VQIGERQDVVTGGSETPPPSFRGPTKLFEEVGAADLRVNSRSRRGQSSGEAATPKGLTGRGGVGTSVFEELAPEGTEDARSGGNA